MPLHFSVTIYREMVSFFKFKFNALFYSSQALYLTEKYYVTLAPISCTRRLDTGQLSLLLLYAETIFFFLLSNFLREYVQNMFRMTMLKKIYIKSPSSANKVSNDKDHYLWKWRYNVLAIEKKSATIDLTDLILKVPIGTYFCRKEDSCPNRAE